MKVYSDNQPLAYDVSGNELRIHWNIVEVAAPDIDGAPRMQWEADEALAFTYDTRSLLISKIIRSEYSVDDEFALINNRDEKPEQYAEFQAFRAQAKALADGWIAQR